MQNRLMLSILAFAAGFALSSTAVAQTELPPPGWKTWPQCLTPEQTRAELKFNQPGMPFNPRDLSGVWHGIAPGVGKEGGLLENTHNVFAKLLSPSGKSEEHTSELQSHSFISY